MPKRGLIAYGSRYGSTEEIARAMVEILEKEGLETHYSILDIRSKRNGPH